ncbi:hypothetical protein WOLCODRAFT_162289 [Wolfiporia cocos MD-104 SS10]|uniref:L domain-like protein n=1 Tax=Wolfiporia cocos (strain MD-104) TaxID=742152 RepID=A0A2H3JRF1_WOLCO|nr:hypothetical protein WOLCODRAFT_162289 [Wolfiporia cocos MD-104 SS10]
MLRSDTAAAQMRPSWLTDELEDEWVEQDEDQSAYAHSVSDISLTQPLSSMIVHTLDYEGESHSAGSVAGTFIIKEEVPEDFLPETPGNGKRVLGRDIFSPLALEKLFEPPPPAQPLPEHTQHPRATTQATTPAVPSRLAQVYVPSPETTATDGGCEDGILDQDCESPAPSWSLPTCRFTFEVPRHSPFNPMGRGFAAQSTPGPSNGTMFAPFTPLTDHRLRLFQLQYDTYTREHLSAVIDSIAIGTPSGASGSTHIVEPLSVNRPSPDSEPPSPSRRAIKRFKTGPAHDRNEDGDKTVDRTSASRKNYIRESRSLMAKIRQSRKFSAETTVATVATAGSAPPIADAGYPRQPANTIIRDDMKGPKRLTADEINMSRMLISEQGGVDLRMQRSSSSNAQPVGNACPGSRMHKSIPNRSPIKARDKQRASPQKVLRNANVAEEVVRDITDNLSNVSLDSERLLEQFPRSPVALTVTTALASPSSHENTHSTKPNSVPNSTHVVPLIGSTGNAPADAAPSLLPTGNADLTRFVSPSTVSGSTLTNGSTASFAQNPGPKHITRITLDDVPALPQRVGKMVFDKVTMKWVKAPALATAIVVAENDRDFTAGRSDNTSEDPFRDIESLRDEDHGRRNGIPEIVIERFYTDEENEMPPVGSRPEVVEDDSAEEDAEEMELTSFSFDGQSAELAQAVAEAGTRADCGLTYTDDDHEDSPDIARPGNQPKVDRNKPNGGDYTDSRDAPKPEDAEPVSHASPPRSIAPIPGISTPHSAKGVTRPVPASALRSALKSNSTTPVSAMRGPNRPHCITPANKVHHRRSVSFSDGKREGPIVGLGRNAPSPDGSAAEDSSPLAASSSRASSSLVPSARSKRIAEMLENLGADAPEDEPKSLAGSAEEPPTEEPRPVKLRRSSSAPGASTSSPSREISRRSFPRSHSVRSPGSASRNGNATFLTECSFGVAHDRLVQVITDVYPFEPHWEQLPSIDLSNRHLDSVARLKEYLPQLDSLNLNHNLLPWLSGIPGTVRSLSVMSNILTSLTSYGHLPNLGCLDISRNEIDSLRQLGCLRHLRELRADGNRIDSIDGLQDMNGLVKLSLQGNNISILDLRQHRWSRLEMLNLSYNRLSRVSGLASLPALIALNLDNNALDEVVPGGPMARLRILRVSGNRLRELDATPFQALRTLYADNNSLGTISKAHRLAKLENLSLRNQSGRAGLTLSICDVRDVKRLYLSGNALPAGFLSEPCYNLVYLELAACRLRALPADLARTIPNVRVLNLNYNFLADARALAGLTRLRKLMMIGARIRGARELVRAVRMMRDAEVLDFRRLRVRDLRGRHQGGAAPCRVALADVVFAFFSERPRAGDDYAGRPRGLDWGGGAGPAASGQLAHARPAPQGPLLCWGLASARSKCGCAHACAGPVRCVLSCAARWPRTRFSAAASAGPAAGIRPAGGPPRALCSHCRRTVICLTHPRRMNPCTLGWYLPLLVRDVPGALQPERDGARARAAAPAGDAGVGPQDDRRGDAGAGGDAAWRELDAHFRRGLPDDAYVARLAYRGLVVRACARVRVLDGVEVSAKEREKAEALLAAVGVLRAGGRED